MSSQRVRIAHSPDSDDAFMFYAMTHGLLDDDGLDIRYVFDDIETLTANISEEFGEWGAEILVDQSMIDQFAEITGDRQWIHINVQRAKRESPFKTPSAIAG